MFVTSLVIPSYISVIISLTATYVHLHSEETLVGHKCSIATTMKREMFKSLPRISFPRGLRSSGRGYAAWRTAVLQFLHMSLVLRFQLLFAVFSGD